MAYFGRPFSATTSDPSSSFTPLFRFLDDFEKHTSNSPYPSRSFNMKTISPKFDVREVADSYELHGELPGIEQKDVEIEFSDQATLTIRGRSERSYTSDDASSAPQIAGNEAPKAITHGDKSHQPTVEDESTEVAKADQKAAVEKKSEEPKGEKPKYWVSERSVGEFSRSFTFPVRVDQDRVTASMKNGILSIVVPKAKKLESRRIAIQ
ncbi:hypothetical protein B7494_g8154 [Chlorociboria aeruginascens]|nr:hypothetical protein B7494_g8154 [Chlorociboria aeruginascens]